MGQPACTTVPVLFYPRAGIHDGHPSPRCRCPLLLRTGKLKVRGAGGVVWLSCRVVL